MVLLVGMLVNHRPRSGPYDVTPYTYSIVKAALLGMAELQYQAPGEERALGNKSPSATGLDIRQRGVRRLMVLAGSHGS